MSSPFQWDENREVDKLVGLSTQMKNKLLITQYITLVVNFRSGAKTKWHIMSICHSCSCPAWADIQHMNDTNLMTRLALQKNRLIRCRFGGWVCYGQITLKKIQLNNLIVVVLTKFSCWDDYRWCHHHFLFVRLFKKNINIIFFFQYYSRFVAKVSFLSL